MSDQGSSGSAIADWYADPLGRHQFRYWDGTTWTANVADGGEQTVDPLEAKRSSEVSPSGQQESRIPLSQFNTLARPAEDHLREWSRHVVQCSLNYPMPSSQGLTAIMQGTRRMSSATIHNMFTLDKQLGLENSLSTVFADLEMMIDGLLRSGKGEDFQSLGAQVQKALGLLEKLRKERTTAD